MAWEAILVPRVPLKPKEAESGAADHLHRRDDAAFEQTDHVGNLLRPGRSHDRRRGRLLATLEPLDSLAVDAEREVAPVALLLDPEACVSEQLAVVAWKIDGVGRRLARPRHRIDEVSVALPH